MAPSVITHPRTLHGLLAAGDYDRAALTVINCATIKYGARKHDVTEEQCRYEYDTSRHTASPRVTLSRAPAERRASTADDNSLVRPRNGARRKPINVTWSPSSRRPGTKQWGLYSV